MDHKIEQDVKQKEAFEKELEKEYPMMFKKRELILIFNLMTTLTMKYGDFIVCDPIIKKLEPIVAVASNIPQKEEPQIVGVKKETN